MQKVFNEKDTHLKKWETNDMLEKNEPIDPMQIEETLKATSKRNLY